MKKIITLIVIFIMLCSCSVKDYSTTYDLETHEEDMSLYEGVDNLDNSFLPTTAEELKRLVDEKGYGIFVFSRTSCAHCQIIMKCIDDVAKEYNTKVFYIDALSDEYPILGTDNFDFLMEYLYDYLQEGSDGPELQTPHVFTIIDGEIVKSKVGTTWNGLEYTNEEMNELLEFYREMFKPFANKNQD